MEGSFDIGFPPGFLALFLECFLIIGPTAPYVVDWLRLRPHGLLCDRLAFIVCKRPDYTGPPLSDPMEGSSVIGFPPGFPAMFLGPTGPTAPYEIGLLSLSVGNPII